MATPQPSPRPPKGATALVAATFVSLQSMPGLVVVPSHGGALVESRTKLYLIPGGIDRVARLC